MTLDNGAVPTAHSRTAGAARPRGYAGTLTAACCAVFVAQVANSLPAALNGLFQRDLGTQGSQLTWITAAFMIAVVCFEFTFGVLGDLFGRKRLVVVGGVLVALGSAVAALAPSVQVIYVGTALNGLGAGAMFPGSLTALASVTRTGRQRAHSIALWSGLLSAGAACSPLLSAFFSGVGSWRGSFWVLVALALVSSVTALALATESRAPQDRSIDIPGQITFAVGLILILYAAVQGPESGWAQPSVLLGFSIGACFLFGFVLVEIGAESPIFDLALFRNRGFTVSSIVSVIGMFAFLGACFATSMWLGLLQHQGLSRIAIPFLLLQGPAVVLIPVVARLLHRVAPGALLTAGFALIAVGCLLCTRLDVTDTDLGAFVVPDLLIGVGFALSVSAITDVALGSVPQQLAGMASATTNMLRDLGFALGPILVGAIALGIAGNEFDAKVAEADLPTGQLSAAREVASSGGPVAVNDLPTNTAGWAARPIALDALGNGFTTAFLVCGIAAAVAAVLSAVGMLGIRAHREVAPEPAVEPARSVWEPVRR